MRTYSLYILFILFILTPDVSFSQKNEKKKTDEELALMVQPDYNDGIIYVLPRVGFNLTVEVQKTTFIPGPYSQYAAKYLGINNAKSNEEVKWKMTSIVVNTFSEPDPNAYFKALNKVASQVALLQNGIITGIQSEGVLNENKVNGNNQIVNDINKTDFTDLSSDDFYSTTVNAETGAESMTLKTQEEKAREAADFLIRLRKKRAYTILDPSDVVPEDGKGYEAFLKEAHRLEKEYVGLFAGKTVQTKHQFRFIYVPEKDDVKNELLFRFSEEKGVLPKTDFSGKPVMLAISADQNANKSINELIKTNQSNTGISGVYYRIPVMADFSISDGITTLYSGRTSIPQFGIVAPFPETLLNGNYSIRFQPETGAILEVKEIKR